MSRRSFKERARERREEEILTAASRLLGERGYAAVSMDEIAEEVGISKPTLYQHFKGKDELIMRAMIRSMEQMEEQILAAEGTPLERLGSLLRSMLTTQTSSDGILASMPDQHVLQLLRDQELADYRQRVGGRLYQLVQEGQACGEITAELPPMVVVGSIFGLASILHGMDLVDDPIHVDAVIEGTVRLFLRGIGSK